LKVPFSKNSVSLNYHVSSLNINVVSLQYKFDQSKWTDLDNPQLSFPSLRRGKHSLDVRAVNHAGINGNIVHTNIYVVPPFYDSWYFTTLVAFCLMLSVWWVVKKRNDRARRKARE